MKAFGCQKCGERLFFENSICLSCNSTLGFLPDQLDLAVIEPLGGDTWRALLHGREDYHYRKCLNNRLEQACTWMVPATDPHSYCRSCRLNRTIPDLSTGNHRALWRKMELAKRRLVYSLLKLRLPVIPKIDDPVDGLAFNFLADASPRMSVGERILTGHANGIITINAGEADDAARETMRLQMGEAYRTLLGHFRHESGHYYWDLLVRSSGEIDAVRNLFGDERVDYTIALQNHYQNGPRPGWDLSYVTPYASSHPWEDWAETWAHYLHIVDTLETAAASGLQVRTAAGSQAINDPDTPAFASVREDWHALRFVINSLNRSMGMPDPYPFVLSDGAAAKLEFVHRWIRKPSENFHAQAIGMADANSNLSRQDRRSD